MDQVCSGHMVNVGSPSGTGQAGFRGKLEQCGDCATNSKDPHGNVSLAEVTCSYQRQH